MRNRVKQKSLHAIIMVVGAILATAGAASAKDCIDCHAAIMKSFKGNSHHIQASGGISAKHCYACHWEAKSDGRVNELYHAVPSKKSAKSNLAKVDLVIWASGVRPETYKLGVTAVSFLPSAIGTSSEREEISRISQHCLGCHRDENNASRPFVGDVSTPIAYAWDGQSVSSRYSQKGVTAWGKYSTANTNKKQHVTKSFSAHGNASANQGGWNPSSGYDGEISNNRAGIKNVECFDCHNSHGSTISGVTSSYRTSDGTFNGGILKETFAGKGGYRMNYKPSVNSYAKSNNPFNAGAGLCFDCHETALSGVTPWGYKSTFGAELPILGYKDTAGFGSGSKGSTARFANRHSREEIVSSHLKAGKTLAHPAQGQINGLCTPCHDPHGVSKTLGDKMSYAVPLLKGTWLTSPYREDGPPAAIPGKGGPSKQFTDDQTDSKERSDYNAVNREANANFGKGDSGAARSADYNAVNREANANFGKGTSGAAKSDFNSVNREANANFGKGDSGAARSADYNAVNREANANFGKGTSGSAREMDSNTTNRDFGSNFAKGGSGAPREPMKGMKYNVDQNTFDGNNRISENDVIFGGICLKCHTKENLTGESTVGQVHRTVRGWGSNKEHSFPCSKCHQSHNSGLPRLMQTNCFEQGPSGLRENSGVPWLPYSKSEDKSPTQDGRKIVTQNASKNKVVGCHVRQFGKATAVSSKEQEGHQWKEVTSW